MPKPADKRRARVTRAVAIMLAFGAEEKAVQPLVLPHGAECDRDGR